MNLIKLLCQCNIAFIIEGDSSEIQGRRKVFYVGGAVGGGGGG